MSKIKTIIAFTLAAVVSFGCFVACSTPAGSFSGNATQDKHNSDQIPTAVSDYVDGDVTFDGTNPVGARLPFRNGLVDSDGMDYNGNLFYYNELRTIAADPHAIYISYEDINGTYDRLVQNYQYLNDGKFEWIEGWDQERFDSEFGARDKWIESYSNKYYMTNTDGVSLTSADAAKYNCSNAYFPIYESPDLNNWHRIGKVSGGAIAANAGREWHAGSYWAPELYRDPATGLYIITYSATGKNGNANTTYSPTSGTFGDVHLVSCAIANTPDGPYYPVTSEYYYSFRAAKNSKGEVITGDTLIDGPDMNRDGQPDYKYYEIYDNRDGKTVIGYKNGTRYFTPAGYELTLTTPSLNSGYYYPRIATDKTKVQEFENTAHITKYNGFGKSNVDICIYSEIDQHLYDDPVSGKTYMYFSNTNGRYTASSGFYGNIWGVEMLDAITPNWDTLTHLTMPGYSTVEHDGSFFGKLGPAGEAEGTVNEGPEVLYYEGKYYLTYSPWGYTSRLYAIQVATSDSPLGEFKKERDYTPVLGFGDEKSNYQSGTGHHCFITVGDELFTLYHSFANAENNNDNKGNFLGRMLAVDRVFFKYEENLGYYMMFANGPSYNLQPKPESYTGYTDVAKLATIEGNGDVGDIAYLSDGMFTAHPVARKYEYGKKEGKLMLTLKWNKPVTVRALQIYNAGSPYYAFKGVDMIVMKLATKPAWYNLDRYNGYLYMENVMCDPADYLANYACMRKGGSAIAEFNPITITEMYIVVSADATQVGVGDNYKKILKNKYVDEYEDFSNGINHEIHLSELYIFGNEEE